MLPHLPRPRRPFEGAEVVTVIPPVGHAGLDPDDLDLIERLPALLNLEAEALRRELGAPVIVAAEPPAHGPIWLIGPAALNRHLAAIGLEPSLTPTLHLDRAAGRLVSDAPDLSGILQTFSALRGLARHDGGPLPAGHATSLLDAVARISREVADTWPSFALRGKAWRPLVEKHAWRVVGASNAGNAITAMQAWLAELDDFHTWVRPVQTQLVLPYGAAVVGDAVVLTNVLPWTAGYAAGARPGDRLLGLDVRGTWATTPAAPHSKPLLVARRLLSGAAGEERRLEARGPGGRTARWKEVFTPPTGVPASWEILPSGTAFLWIGAWVPGFGVEETIEEAFDAFGSCERLIVDLRGNSGGRLAMAHAFRDRFVPDERVAGWIRTTVPGGRLGPPEVLRGVPAAVGRWQKPVRFLTSPLSYSSSEDALLGLQGLPNVQVWGEPSGGGSGRLRRLHLLPGWRLTISTSLTYTTRGECIEGNGVPLTHPVNVDRARPAGYDVVLAAADAAW